MAYVNMAAARSDFRTANASVAAVEEQLQWFAVMTRPRHEKKAAQDLQQSGITCFLPLVREIHRWSDRKQIVDVPLFSGYAFVQIPPVPKTQVAVLRSSGVLCFVGAHGRGTAIPDPEIEHIRTVVEHKAALEACGFLKVGQRVRIRSGCLDGVEGIIVAQNNTRKLVLSIGLIQKSIAISVEGYTVEPV